MAKKLFILSSIGITAFIASIPFIVCYTAELFDLGLHDLD
jgi:hypothetical protein